MTPALPQLTQVAATESFSGILAALAAMGHAAWIVDAACGHILAANVEAEELLERGVLEGLDADDAIPDLEDMAYWDGVRCGVVGVLESDAELHLPGGRSCAVSRRIAPVWLADGSALFLVQVRDRSREHRIEIERETALAELRATLEATADAILVTDLNGRIRAFNRRFARMWSLPDGVLHANEDRGVHDWVRMNVMDVDAYDRRLEDVYAHTLAEAHDEIAQVNGALIERHAQPQWSHGRPIGRVFSFRELNPHRAGAPREPGNDGVDQLTHLPNRTGFLLTLEDALRSCRQSAGFAVLCIEFNRDALFGEGGDSAAGARRLSELAGHVRGAMRQPHHCARLGGSRFGVLIDYASEVAGEAAARRLIESQERVAGVPVAIGIGTYPGAGLSADEILRHVEIAMHRAQQASRSSFAVHKFGFESWQRRRDRVEAGLLRAAEEGRFRLAAQPRFDTAAGLAVALEVHLRWRDRELGEVAASQFMGVAQERGLVGALDDWVLEHGLLQQRRWREAGHPLRLNIHVSDWQLTQPGYARRVAAALESAGSAPSDLEIDVAESALQADPDAALAAVRSLARQGVRVMLGGFGAGTSSLAALQRLPFTGVKLDATLAQACAGAGAESRWVPALVQLVHAMQLEVHANGVDTELQCKALRQAGCDGLQGRRLGPWMEERALESWFSLPASRRRLG
jgi:EAL domain-containing protein (putative c-di-GMP-specific phosphodiesterase class I)/GGDEF domain-containing protein/PAS domain-containing protein